MLHAALHGDGFKEQSLYSWFVERLAEQLGLPPPSTSRRLVKADGKGGRGKRIEWGGSRRGAAMIIETRCEKNGKKVVEE